MSKDKTDSQTVAGLEEGESNGEKPANGNQLTSKNSDDEIKSALCLLLEAEHTHRTDSTQYETGKEKIASAQQKRWLGWLVAVIAAIVPLIALSILACQLSDPKSVLACMDAIPQAVFISATFISFIAVYASLIKNIFQASTEKPPNPVMKDALEILNTLRRHPTE